ncbi:MAG TPA: ATP-binding cassette domain-containing protein, partial [Gemmatimonadales bacterium]|nr:ATP-binding cassette domain-containing protein [Gemmatimonadales bacterium]
GENGAGKTTLMNIAYGILRPDSGEIADTTRGALRVRRGFDSPAQARAVGIGMVHQHFTSIGALTVGENIALAAGWRETGRAAERRATALIARLRLPVDAGVLVDTLSVQLRQRLEIVKALAADARVLLLDEPSAVLAPREVTELLQLMRAFAAAGGAVILITHKLDEVRQAADRVTVLRRGTVAFSGPVKGESAESLARHMLGADLPREPQRQVSPGDALVMARNVTLAETSASAHSVRVADATFDWRAGEVIGIAAVEGNGQRQLLRAIAGIDDVTIVKGTLAVAGPVAFVPEDRTVEGIIPAFTITENLLLGTLDRAPRWLDWHALRARAAALISAFSIRAGSPDSAAATLSGGNQQKLILARALERRPRVIVAEDPTRGLDVQAARAIHSRLIDAAVGGALVVVHSSDLDEVLTLADRVVVIANGDLTELPPDVSRAAAGDAMLGMAVAQ